MADGTETVEVTVVEIRLRNGDTMKARVGEASDLEKLHRSLHESEFVRVGDDTIVRSADVQSVQMREGGSGGLIDSLKARVSGEGSDEAREQRDRRPRPRLVRMAETKPFFLTSEFLLVLLAGVGLLVTTLASDSVDGRTFVLLTAAIATAYMLSRGAAKARTPSSAWDPREDLVSPPS